MSSSKNKNKGGAARAFFDRFREEVAGYAEGVHRLGDPAPNPALAKVEDDALRDFLASWNGAMLFIDAYTIHPAEELEADPESNTLWFGETSLGDRLGLQPPDGGRVVRLEEDTGELLVEASSFARWLDATIVADGVLYDEEGEYLDEVFDDDGEIAPAASVKREKKALKVDPEAPAPAWRLARAQERSGDAKGARATLEALVGRVKDFAWAWFDLGRLRHDAGDSAGAEAAFAEATEAGAAQGSELAGWFAAHAARMASLRKDEAARARHAERALAGLAAALLPRDLEVAELSRRIAAASAKARK